MTDNEIIELYREAIRLSQSGKKFPAKMVAQMTACNNCGQHQDVFYMLRNDLWKIVNPPRHGHLCLSCLAKRFRERVGRKLRRNDFGDELPFDDENHYSIRSINSLG